MRPGGPLRTLLLVAAALVVAAALGGEPPPPPPTPSTPPPEAGTASCDFEEQEPWSGWKLEPAEPREAGFSEWEERELEFLAPASGAVTVQLMLEGAGRLDFDDLEITSLGRKAAPSPERRLLSNPGFETAEDGKPGAPTGWRLSGSARRAADSARTGGACLRLESAAPGNSAASQELALPAGSSHRLVLRFRGSVMAGKAVARVAAPGKAGTVLAVEEFTASTLAGGSGRCGRVSAARGEARSVQRELTVKAGSNAMLELLLRGRLGDRGRLRVEVSALDEASGESALASRVPARTELGADWRPLRLNLALAGVRRLRLGLRVDGPGWIEADNLRLQPPRALPAPRRFTAGDAGDNFRPKGRWPLVTSRGRADAELVSDFTGLLGQRMTRPTAFWQFWRSGQVLDHQPRPFDKVVEAQTPDGTVWLLDASGQVEAKWLAERAVTVPDRPGAYAISASAKALIVAARSREGFLAAASTLGWLCSDGPEPEVFSCRVEDWPAHDLRAAAVEFDGRLAEPDREQIARLSAFRFSHLLITGRGLWQLPDAKTRTEARDLLDQAGRLGLATVPFLEAIGAAPALVERVPASAEMVWRPSESHFLRGTERSSLSGRNVVAASGAPVEVTSENGELYAAGRDYEIEEPAPRPEAEPETAPRTRLRRRPSGRIPDGGRVTVSYNALPPPTEPGAACPRSIEALDAFRAQIDQLTPLCAPGGLGLGGALPARMRTDRRTAGTRFTNGRLVADRLAELVAVAAAAAPKSRCFLWADLLNPCGGLKLPEDSPASSADLIDPAVRTKLILLVRLPRSDGGGREMMARSARFLLARGYRTAGWCGSSGAAAELWAAELAACAKELAPPKEGGQKPGEPAGLVLDLGSARALDIERFAEAAWTGAPAPTEAPAEKKP